MVSDGLSVMKFSGKRLKVDKLNWRQPSQKTIWILSILGLLLISSLLYLWNLGSVGLIDETEPLFAETSRQMLVTGDWITAYYNGVIFIDKPPLINWTQAIAYLLLGVNEWAMRLPSALSAIALMGLGFYTLRYYGFATPKTIQQPKALQEKQLWFSALIGATVIGLNPMTIAWGRIGVTDMLLTLCIAGALMAFFIAYATATEQGKKLWYWAFYALLGLAVLSKGPIGIALPGLIIAAFLLFLGNFKAVLSEMRLLSGSLIFLAIVLPWHILMTWQNGQEFINVFFGYHNIERFTSVINYHGGPWYFYIPVVLLGFAPWCIYLPVAIARTKFWCRDDWRNQPRTAQLSLFAIFWFVIIFVFFSMAVTKRANYVLPAIPAAAMLLGLLWSSELTSNNRSSSQTTTFYKVSGFLNLLFLLALSAALVIIPSLLDTPEMPTAPLLLQQSGLPVVGGVIWLGSAVALGLLMFKQRWGWLWSANLIGFLVFFIFVGTPVWFLMDEARHLPLRQLSFLAAQVAQPGEQLIALGIERPSIVFYTQKTVDFVVLPGTSGAKRDYLQSNAASQPYASSLLIFTQPENLPKVGLQPNEYQTLGKAGVYQLIRLPKQGAIAPQ